MTGPRLRTIPVTLRQANAYVSQHHRHHKPVRGCRFCIGVEIEGQLVGVVIVGRPVARGCDYQTTAEVTRLCTDGTRNACSLLYAAAARAAAAMGYQVIQTYIMTSEPGTTLKAAGWVFDGNTDGGDWSAHRPDAKQLSLNGRVRRGDQPMGPKLRYVKYLRVGAPR
jgi:hypothetical protein